MSFLHSLILPHEIDDFEKGKLSAITKSEKLKKNYFILIFSGVFINVVSIED